MNNAPLVSVIIPTFEGAQYITEAIKSVLAQTFKNLEIIVIDDGSTDDTKTILRKWIEEGAIKYIYQQNKGLGGARNTGIRASTGKFLKFLDHDDLLYPQQLEYQTRHLEGKSPSIISATDYEMEFEDKRKQTINVVFPANQLARFIQGPACVVHTVLIQRSMVDRVNGFDETLTSCEDRDFWLRVLIEGAVFEKVNYVGCCYRILKGSLSSNPARQLEQRCRIFEKLNKTLFPRFEQLGPDLLQQLLLSNIKLVHMCFARKTNPDAYLPLTLRSCNVIYFKKNKGNWRNLLKIIGIQNILMLKFIKACFMDRNYHSGLINTNWWRGAAQ